MSGRAREKIVTFNRPFLLKGIDRVLPAGQYRVTTDEELIESLSFPVYRRVAFSCPHHNAARWRW